MVSVEVRDVVPAAGGSRPRRSGEVPTARRARARRGEVCCVGRLVRLSLGNEDVGMAVAVDVGGVWPVLGIVDRIHEGDGNARRLIGAEADTVRQAKMVGTSRSRKEEIFHPVAVDIDRSNLTRIHLGYT